MDNNKQKSHPGKTGPHLDLYLAATKLLEENNPANIRAFSRILGTCINEKVWLHMPVIPDEHGEQLVLLESRGKSYAAVYSDPSQALAKGRILWTDINNLIDPVFATPDIAGIVIDPETTVLYLDKRFILKAALHARYPGLINNGSPKKDWGAGIPSYQEADVMTADEMLNFAIQTVVNYDKELSLYQPISVCDHPEATPNLIYQHRDEFIFVDVVGYCAKDEPGLSAQKRELLLSLGRKYHAKCYYAAVGFLPIDAQRCAANLPLRGDGFYANYRGLQEIK